MRSKEIFLYISPEISKIAFAVVLTEENANFLHDVENNGANARTCAGVFLLASLVWRKPFG